MLDARNLRPEPAGSETVAWMDRVLTGLRAERSQWRGLWMEIAKFYLPRKLNWLERATTPQQQRVGALLSTEIVDGTGTVYARNLATAVADFAAGPSHPWLHLKPAWYRKHGNQFLGFAKSQGLTATAQWFADTSELLREILAASNFYQVFPAVVEDHVLFGSGVLMGFKHPDSIIRFYHSAVGEFYIRADEFNKPVGLYREFTLNATQLVQQFGQAVPEDVLTHLNAGTAMSERLVCHAIEPASALPEDLRASAQGPYLEAWWLSGRHESDGLLRFTWLDRPHFAAGRWTVFASDPYGRSPCLDALYDVKQLQHQQLRKAQLLDQLGLPHLLADQSLKSSGFNNKRGGVTFVSGLMSGSKPPVQPTISPTTGQALQALSADIEQTHFRIRQFLFGDLLQAISQNPTRSNVTAAEVEARQSEAMLLLTSALMTISTEILEPIISMTLGIAEEMGILPNADAMVQELQSRGLLDDPESFELQANFVNKLTQAQDAERAVGLQRLIAMAAPIVQMDPTTAGAIDGTNLLRQANKLFGNTPDLIRSDEEIQGQQQQQQANGMTGLAAGKIIDSIGNIAEKTGALEL